MVLLNKSCDQSVSQSQSITINHYQWIYESMNQSNGRINQHLHRYNELHQNHWNSTNLWLGFRVLSDAFNSNDVRFKFTGHSNEPVQCLRHLSSQTHKQGYTPHACYPSADSRTCIAWQLWGPMFLGCLPKVVEQPSSWLDLLLTTIWLQFKRLKTYFTSHWDYLFILCTFKLTYLLTYFDAVG